VTGITTHELFEAALDSVEPVWELRGVIRGLLADGHSRDTLLHDLEALQLDLREAGRDADEDAVLDVMDFVVGWSSPHTRL
jgi:hypothetical protein